MRSRTVVQRALRQSIVRGWKLSHYYRLQNCHIITDFAICDNLTPENYHIITDVITLSQMAKRYSHLQIELSKCRMFIIL
jgi:hypothetical protein